MNPYLWLSIFYKTVFLGIVVAFGLGLSVATAMFHGVYSVEAVVSVVK